MCVLFTVIFPFFQARAQNKSSADELVRYALDVMPSRGVQDNISAIVVFFHESG